VSTNDGFWTRILSSTAVDEEVALRYHLHVNYPNPFNPKTTVRFDQPKAAHAQIGVYDVSGRLVRVLLDEQMPAGRHTIDWDGRGERGSRMPSGIYFIRMHAGSFTAHRKAVMLK
jgi:hypothetical protein